MSNHADFKRLNTRPASIVQVGGFRPTRDPFATNFGFAPVGAPGQAWPEFEGRPMMFVCQLNLTGAPLVPPPLEDVKLLTFFMAGDIPLAQENGRDWQLFAHPALDGLVPMTAPPGAPKLGKKAECSWSAASDHPEFDDPDRKVPEGFDDSEVEIDNLGVTKIGGYASTIQGENWWHREEHPAKPAYCLQINSEEKVALMFADAGIVYIARGTADGHRDEWFMDCQFY